MASLSISTPEKMRNASAMTGANRRRRKPIVLNDTLDWALKYSRAGFSVFPVHSVQNEKCTCGKQNCSSPGKHPFRDLAPHSFKNATRNEQTIRDWFTQYPHLNIGIATGNGIGALDIDPKSGGYESLEKLIAENGELPDTLIAITGSGGQHILFRYSGQIGNSIKRLPGVDFRGDGGYIVATPSKHESGNQYKWLNWGTAIAEMPHWVSDLVTKKGVVTARKNTDPKGPVQSTTTKPDFTNLSLDEMLECIGDHENGSGFHGAIQLITSSYIATHGITPDQEKWLLDKLCQAALHADWSKHDPTEIKRRIASGEIWQLIHSAIKKFDNPTRQKPQLLQDLPPHYTADLLTRDQAVKRLRKLFEEGIARRIFFAIAGPAGIGKTSLIIEMIVRDYAKKQVEIYVPTHALAQELEQKLKDAGYSGAIKVIRGREQVNANEETLCKKIDVVRVLTQVNQRVFSSLCRSQQGDDVVRCEHFDQCPYIQQFKIPLSCGLGSKGLVRIYTHAMLPQERGYLEKDDCPDLVIIDESFYQQCLGTAALKLQELNSKTLSTRFGPLTAQVGSKILETLVNGLPLLATIRSTFDLKTITAAIREAKSNDRPIVADMPTSEQLQNAKRLHSAPVLKLLQLLAAEYSLNRDESHAIRYDPTHAEVVLHWRKGISRFKLRKDNQDFSPPIIHIDANANKQILQQFFQRGAIRIIHTDRNAYVTQTWSTRGATCSMVADRNSNERYQKDADRRIQEIQQLIDRESREGTKVLVIGPQAITGNPKQQILPKVQVPEHCELAHFNGFRGLDEWKDFDTIIIIGRNQPPIKGLEATARCLFYDSADPLEFVDDWIAEERGYRMRDRSQQGVHVPVHPDPRIQLLLEQIRECEILQAIDRLRLIHNNTPKKVLILTNTVLDITVDELKSFQEMVHGEPWQHALLQLNDVLPLQAVWLTQRFPDIWETQKIAEHYVRNKINARKSQLLQQGMKFYEYALHGQRRWSKCLSRLGLNETEAQLKKLIGPSVHIRESE